MEEKTSFFSKDHDRLLNIATWARYLAWVVLAWFFLWGISSFLVGMSEINQQFGQLGQQSLMSSETLRHYPFSAIYAIFSAIGTLFKGVVYYLVLTGISLGLNMVVETDINYREKAEAAQ